jgi:SAM-dependent methyltransferase
MWYKSWFNSPYYHLLYRGRDEDEAAAFIDQILKYLQPSTSEWILDLGCGKGRHSIYMNQCGYKVEGVDISEQNIAYAKQFENNSLHFTIHDMLMPFRQNHFALIVNLFTSFGYFDALEDNLQVLKAAHFNLKPKGRILIDYLNVELVRDTLVKRESSEVDGVHFDITRTIENEMIVKRIDVSDNGCTHHFEERVKALDRQHFNSMLLKSGFEVLDTFGNYALDQFNPSISPRLITIARKIK